MHAFSLIFSEAQQSAIGKIFGKAIHSRNSGYVRPPVQTVGGEIGQSLGPRVFGQFSLKGNSVAVLHLATHIFVAGGKSY